MQCKKCNSKTRVVNSRSTKIGVWRRRECLTCKARRTTYEVSADKLDLYDIVQRAINEESLAELSDYDDDGIIIPLKRA